MTRSRLPAFALACAAALLLLVCAAPAQAVDPTQMPTPQLESRYLALTHEFRCPVCENETLADSDEEYAAEIRVQIRQMLLAGKSDREIRDYMVSRYTEFILFKPEYSLRNAWLWLAPLLLLVIGALVAWRIIRARSALVGEDREPIDDDLVLEPAVRREEGPAPPAPRGSPALKGASPR